MRASSAKAKGRRLAQRLAGRLVEVLTPHLSADDVRAVPSGVPGEDLWLSPRGRELIPYTFECKNVEKINVWDAIRQAENHSRTTGHEPAVVFSKNREGDFVILRLEHFLEILREKSRLQDPAHLGDRSCASGG